MTPEEFLKNYTGDAHTAMRDYAKIQAIGFSEWSHENYQMVFYLHREWKWCSHETAQVGGLPDKYYTTEQLYQLYLNHLQNEK